MLKKGLYFLSCFLSLWQVSWSQTEHYASQNFNTTSALLSGAVVGGEAGVSASFYNPSLISEIDENNLAINASLISITGMKLQNALGEGIDISNVKAKVQPRFLSYTTTTDGDRKVDMEMVVLTRIINKPVSYIRISMDVTVTIIGYLLGGPLGLGSVISAIALGYSMQFFFKIGKFDCKSKQLNLIELFKIFKQK